MQSAMMARLANLENQLKGLESSSKPRNVDLVKEIEEVEEFVLHWRPHIGLEG